MKVRVVIDNSYNGPEPMGTIGSLDQYRGFIKISAEDFADLISSAIRTNQERLIKLNEDFYGPAHKEEPPPFN